MSLVSNLFLLFVAASVLVYYIVPHKFQWLVLLCFSYIYYLAGGVRYVGFLLFSTLITWLIALAVEKTEAKGSHKGARNLLVLGLLLNFGMLGVVKYTNFAIENLNALFHMNLRGMEILLPLGISFYTFQSMGYVMDVYREKVEPQKNVFKLALFVSFFPQIIQGPIAIYDNLAGQLYEGHDFKFRNIQKGAMLILWGALKKLVIADRAVNIINFVMDKPMSYSGTYVLFAALVYALQLYADFSGGIDIVRGVAEMFGINMSINFNHPYFSRSLTEYWHRWHMTLGDWCRNYIFYPLSISKKFLNFGKWLKPRFGKHISKVFPGCVASLITFIVIGVWHGSNLKYLYFGLWNGIVIMISELFAPVNNKVADKFFDATKLKRNGIFATIVSVIWTFIMVLIGYYFDIAKNATTAFRMLGKSVTDFHIGQLRPGMIIKNIGECGLDKADLLIIFVAAVALFFISLYEEKKKVDLRDVILSKKLPARWAILYVGIFVLIIFGYYGPGVNPADFVYMQF